jgi:hypothetical protein
MGFVLGILFPSLWRTFRRRFRKETQYTPFSENWHKNSELNLQILKDENVLEEYNVQDNKEFIHVKMIEAFMMAHHFFQTGKTRFAIQTYIEILGNETVSKQETNRALFELSQIYLSMGLFGRAFDTAFELLNRKPLIQSVLIHILEICRQGQFPEKSIQTLNIYKGPVDLFLRRSVASYLNQTGELYLDKKQLGKAMEFARLAANWNRASARTLVLLWQITSQIFWQKDILDSKSMWVAMAADLDARAQIYLKTKISPAAGAEYLSSLILRLCQSENAIESYSIIESEFQKTLEWKKLAPDVEKNLLESIFYAIILLQDRQEVDMQQNFTAVLSLLINKKKTMFYKNMFFSEKPSKPEVLGFFAHQCGKCHSQFISFSWKCPQCAAEESLVPVLSPLLE